MPAPQSQRWSLRPTLNLDSDKFQCFNQRRQTRQRSIASEFQIGHCMAHNMHDVCYIMCTVSSYWGCGQVFHNNYSSFIYPRDYVSQKTREIRPAVLLRESSTQLIMYSLDTCVGYSTYIIIVLTNFKSGLRCKTTPWRP